MKKRILWLGLSLLLVASVVLSSCGKTSTTTNVTQTTTQTTTQTGTQSTTTTAVKTTTTTTAAPIEPQYGGILNFIGYRTAQPPTTWDLVIGNTNTDYWSDPYTEFLLTADIAGQGPRGTNAFNFQMQETIPAQYLTGQLAETWEQTDPLTLTFHIRHGVMWAGNAKIGMTPREFTAKDAEFSLNRYWQSPNGGANMYYLDSITADGNYTLNVKFKSYNPDWYYRIAYGIKCGFVPPEVAAAGAADWRNQVGTGPFIISDYVAGSYATYKKNPNYWGKTTINGKEYSLPFINELGYPVITDESSRISAVRTGKADVGLATPTTYKNTLSASSPDLIIFDYLKNNFYQILFKCDSGIFSNVNVRRALMIGTDLQKIANAVYPGGAEINAGPLAPTLPGISTPIDEYPASTKELFTYDPAKATQMLADSGYPSGSITMEIMCQSNATEIDIVSLLADMWSKLGVTVQPKPVETAVWTKYFLGKSFKNALVASTGNSNPVSSLQYKSLNVPYNFSNWNDPKAAALFNQAIATQDANAQNALFKELNIYVLDQCSMIPMPAPKLLGTYWPWVKNYYHEIEGGYQNYVPIIRLMWIDSNLKKSLGH